MIRFKATLIFQKEIIQYLFVQWVMKTELAEGNKSIHYIVLFKKSKKKKKKKKRYKQVFENVNHFANFKM